MIIKLILTIDYYLDPLSTNLILSQDSQNHSHVLFILSNLICSNINLHISVLRLIFDIRIKNYEIRLENGL